MGDEFEAHTESDPLIGLGLDEILAFVDALGETTEEYKRAIVEFHTRYDDPRLLRLGTVIASHVLLKRLQDLGVNVDVNRLRLYQREVPPLIEEYLSTAQQERKHFQEKVEEVYKSPPELEDDDDIEEVFAILLVALVLVFIVFIASMIAIKEGEKAYKSVLSLFATDTPVPTLMPSPTNYPVIIIDNQLVLPVIVTVGGATSYLEAGATLSVEVSRTYTDVEFQTVRRTNDNGEPWGGLLSGTFYDVRGDTTLNINNVIGGNIYFYPQLTNETPWNCSIIIDDGYESAAYPGELPSGWRNVTMGYYRFYSNSNVTLACDNNFTYWWGIRPGNGGNSLAQPSNTSGLMELTLNRD